MLFVSGSMGHTVLVVPYTFSVGLWLEISLLMLLVVSLGCLVGFFDPKWEVLDFVILFGFRIGVYSPARLLVLLYDCGLWGLGLGFGKNTIIPPPPFTIIHCVVEEGTKELHGLVLVKHSFCLCRVPRVRG